MNIKLGNGGDNTGTSAETNIKKSNKKTKIIVISSLAAIIMMVFIGVATYTYTTVTKYEGKIMPGVLIEGIDMGGKTKEEAIQELNGKYNDGINGRVINIKAADKEYVIKYEDLKVQFNIDETVEKAFQYNRELGYLEKFKAIRQQTKQEFAIDFTYEDDVINNMATTMESEINVEKKDATISKSGGSFSVTDEVIGKTLDVQGLIENINAKVVETKEGNLEIVATVSDDTPKKTKDQLATIDTKVGTKTTNFRASDASRSTNISLGAQAVNGTVLMPGETFSFNTTVGDTTPDKGYMSGGVYVGDKLEQGYGGGICQVSSTLYNAVLGAGIMPDQRTNHNMTVGYVPLGLDATISYGSLDYVFTNPYKFPIYIEGYAGGGSVTFNVYSNSAAMGGKTYSYSSETYETIPLTVKYEDDATLPVGTEKVSQQGSPGYKVKAYKTTYENGTEISTEIMNNDTYISFPKIVKKGTKVVETKPATPAPTPAPAPAG